MLILAFTVIYLIVGVFVGIILDSIIESFNASFNSISFNASCNSISFFVIPLWPIYLLLFFAGFLFRFMRIVFIGIYNFKITQNTIVDDACLLLNIKRK